MSASVLLLHGWATNHHIFDYVRTKLPSQCNFITPDLPGHGQTALTDTFDPETIAQTLAYKLKEPVHVIGWSLGGLIGQYLAAYFPHLVKSLCLTASNSQFIASEHYEFGAKFASLQKFAQLFEKDYTRHITQFLQLQILAAPAQKPIVAELLPKLTQYGVPVGINNALESLKNNNSQPILAKITCPSLLIYGQKDGLVPVQAGLHLNTHITNSRLLILPRAAHAPFLSHPNEFALALTDFWHNYDYF
ncbi:pimeloyl-ACP methyl ester esterase BioH [Neisseria sp. Ec49-e6-T10]|uniref:pimeloyl-ACP methyl ester esterase BioH n=1 Tax=Neisseria sp. Ec49-e6-T10 TaxID=3140744 RepID=UPI003EBC2D9B